MQPFSVLDIPFSAFKSFFSVSKGIIDYKIIFIGSFSVPDKSPFKVLFDEKEPLRCKVEPRLNYIFYPTLVFIFVHRYRTQYVELSLAVGI